MTATRKANTGYGSPAYAAQRIREWLGKYAGENTASLLLYEAMKALEATAPPAPGPAAQADEVRGVLQAVLDHDKRICEALIIRKIRTSDDASHEVAKRDQKSWDGVAGRIRAILAAPAAPASEPAGWKLVPVQSTPEIQSAISSALFDQQVGHDLIGKLDMADIYAAIIDEAPAAPAPKLRVFYGPMPESNGKHNYTVILYRDNGNDVLDLADGITIERSEYPDRVRYEADRVRYLLGELTESPNILDYDANKHSGYVAPAQTEPFSIDGRDYDDAAPAPAAQADMDGLASAMHDAAIRYANGHTVDFQHEAREFVLSQQSATPPECTCPSGNGSLRHPCPVHPIGAVVDANTIAHPTSRYLFKKLCKLHGIEPGCTISDALDKIATPADAASDPIRAVVQAAVDLMEAREWAEHFAECHAPGDALASRLEACITDLHNEAYGGEDRADAASAADKRDAGGNLYLCKAWGETDLPAAAMVTDLDGVRTFLIAEWLGSADETHDDGTNSLDDALQDMQEQWVREGDAWEWSTHFEIGGVSVQKVYEPAFQRERQQGADRG
jgi:hypothetical protein